MKSKAVQFGVIAVFGAVILSGLSFGPPLSAEHFSTSGQDLCFEVPRNNHEARRLKEPRADKAPYLGKSFAGFKEALGFKESGGDYRVVNSFGYLGKYQFGSGTLRLIGINNPEEFIKNPDLQEAAFEAYVSRNKWVLRRELKKYVGKSINGITITESGVLAAAHLAGPGNVKKYLRSGGSRQFSDAFGTTIGYYLKKFSGYDTADILPDRKARVF